MRKYPLTFNTEILTQSSPILFIITGRTGSGKTTFLSDLVVKLAEQPLKIGGFLAPRSVPGEEMQVYDILFIANGQSIPLAAREPVEGWSRIANFYFNQKAIRRGNEILNDPMIPDMDIVIIDEVGIFELEGKVWSDAISRLLEKKVKIMIWVVRNSILEQVIHKWDIQNPVILDIKKVTVREAAEMIWSVF